jgi:hypothetical protein
MTATPHPAATAHLPAFITAPGETDVLMVVMALILILSVLGFGIFFFTLHSLPERMAHKSHKMQLEIVAVLCLISLFTHMHIFWIAGLLLAMIDLPDFGGSLSRIAGSTEKMAGIEPAGGADLASAESSAADEHRQGDGGATLQAKTESASTKPEIAPTKKKEPIHA